MSLQWDLTNMPGPFHACPEISKTSRQPLSLMQSSPLNSSVCVMHHIHDGQENRSPCMYQILHKIAENGNQNLWMINDKHFGHLSLSTNDEVIAKLCDLVRADWGLTIREVAKELEISSGPCQEILSKHLGMRCGPVKFILQLLTAELKEHYSLSVACDLLECAEADENCF